MEIYISDKYKIKDKSEYDLSIIELYDKDNNLVCRFGFPEYLRQLSDNRFVSISLGHEFYFSVFDYFKEGKKTIYAQNFTELDLPNMIIGDTFILENIPNDLDKHDQTTTLYNCKSGKYFSDSNLKVVKTTLDNNEEFLLGTKTITEGNVADKLTMLINPDSLEADGFYSELQDRYIKIKENDGTTFDKDYNVRLVETLVEEVYPYLTILDKRRSIEKDEKSKVIKKVLISKLNDKSE